MKTAATTEDRPELPSRTLTRAGSASVRDAVRDAKGEAADRSRVELHIAASEWVAAAHLRDIDKLMALYAPVLADFEGAHDVSRAAVRADKRRMLAGGQVIAVLDPAMPIAPDGRSATSRLRLRVPRPDGTFAPTDVVREFGWVLTPDGWKIDRERDVAATR